MRSYTLGFLFKNGKIILAKKKRKIGAGKWNGYGGRVEEGEDKSECLVREILEECEVLVEKEKCQELGYVDFVFENKAEILRIFMYRVDEFSGEPKETAEMGSPKEFNVDKIPYDEMMVGDDKFMPLVIEGKKFKGEINLSEDGAKLLRCAMSEIVDEKKIKKIKIN